MKELIFLLLILLAGFSLAFAAVNPAQPPGVFAEAVLMAEYGIKDGTVTQPTDIVFALSATAGQFILQSLMSDNIALISDKTTVKSQFSMINSAKLECSCGSCADYHLRL